MVDPVSADFSVRMQLIVDVLAQTLDRAVLFDDEELTPITHSRQLGELDDVRVHSVLQRETRAEVKAALFEFGIGSADSALWIPAFPQYNLMPRLCVPVRSASERFGYLWIIVPDGSLSEHGRQLAERAGADLRDVLDRRNAALRAEESAQQGLLMRLIAADEPGQAAAVVAELQTRAMAEPHDVVQVFRFRPGAAAKVDPVDRSLALRLRLAATDRTRRWYTLAGSPHHDPRGGGFLLRVCDNRRDRGPGGPGQLRRTTSDQHLGRPVADNASSAWVSPVQPGPDAGRDRRG
ncbi:hypothetical protein XA26_49050 [Mycolicibacterium fortuitum]|uniref:CdaR family transcriptional regulator n=1 Tax=Mycolicibacterium fortuitum TaxID=1766 RepID=A0A0N9YG01_MYCFO|nr:hypothetical protein [Mycolicibacterium fortuitum]ALI28700.1 hypothetical protein XA26_49050 [Mycolicibacterium fortuitum]MDG5768484.1 hypothetical protein [Mycolicibacterium fortuitum]MDG5785160.1 hypothetical protein [Mycolicibacterium fortuitum]OBB03620.1 hypothetical protein A5668_19390 [Mycolicibacterium fortuitum]UBV22838.1 hypothetical protein H8Z59_06670 [Mycolicibacterium fortuitum]